MRYKQKFYYWCREAVSKIVYMPDKNKVYNELFEHLLDRHESFVAKGMDEDTAADKTIETMGDAKALAPMLGAIHRPGWAYAMVLTRALVVLLLVALLISFVYFKHNEYYYHSSSLDKFSEGPFAEEPHKQIYSVEPNVKSSSDGYTFTVEKAVVWADRMVIRLKATNPIPWSRTPTAPLYMWAQDSNGNQYISHSQSGRMTKNAVFVQMEQYNLTTYYYDLYLYGSMQDVQWLTLCYDRSGRDITLHIDLKGG